MVVHSNRDLSLVHIKKNPKYPFFLELLASKSLSVGSIAVPQLSYGVVGPSKRVITECSFQVEFSILCNPNLDLVFRSRISDYFPVVDAFIEAFVCDDRPE